MRKIEKIKAGIGRSCTNLFFSEGGVFETGFLCVALAILELSINHTILKLRDPPASAS